MTQRCMKPHNKGQQEVKHGKTDAVQKGLAADLRIAELLETWPWATTERVDEHTANISGAKSRLATRVGLAHASGRIKWRQPLVVSGIRLAVEPAINLNLAKHPHSLEILSCHCLEPLTATAASSCQPIILNVTGVSGGAALTHVLAGSHGVEAGQRMGLHPSSP